MSPQSKQIDAYLKTVSPEKRKALQELRELIQETAPDAEECISYGMPCFKWNGGLVAFAAAVKHCALYPMSGTLIDKFKTELKEFSTSKGTIRFTPDAPLPTSLIRKIIKARMAENKAIAEQRKKTKSNQTKKRVVKKSAKAKTKT